MGAPAGGLFKKLFDCLLTLVFELQQCSPRTNDTHQNNLSNEIAHKLTPLV